MLATENTTSKDTAYRSRFVDEINRESNKLIEYFLWSYFIFGFVLAFWYDTWLVALGVGGTCMALYYLSKLMFPKGTLNQYMASAAVGIFTGQFVYQMHGLFEMHFFAFIGSALMITYQNWKLLLPVSGIVAVHHGLFAYLEYKGYDQVYFTTSTYDMDLQSFGFHIFLAVVIFFICALWSYNLEKTTEMNTRNIIMVEELSNTLMKNVEYASILADGRTNFKIEADQNDILGEALLKIQSQLERAAVSK